ncbi:TPA_asm: hypothetical protein GZX19_10280 [Listeria monocytogenes]|nr:hypothetical protein [Listeria monocytogenes]
MRKVEIDFNGFLGIDALIKLDNLNICASLCAWCGGIGTIKTLVGYARYDAYALTKKRIYKMSKMQRDRIFGGR